MISPDAPPYKGGISRLVGLLKEELNSLGHQVVLVNPKIRLREFKFSTIPFHRYHTKYDLIHVHGPTPFLSDLTLIMGKRDKIVYTHHAEICWLSERLSKVYRNFHRFLVKHVRAIIVHSYDYAKLFRHSNIFVIRMPCIFNPASNSEIWKKSNSFTVLYVGQFRPFKGLEMLIKVALTLQGVNFVLVGSGYLKSKLIRMARDAKNIKFVGIVSDDELRQMYSSSHVICLPSINTTEAYGLVLIEGALHGCVPIASNLLGVRENVLRLKGLLFHPRSYDQLRQKISMLSKDKHLWTKLAIQSQKAALSYCGAYTSKYYVKKHEEVFQRCI
jgi:rhamnosyl/mannosyltransferase